MQKEGRVKCIELGTVLIRCTERCQVSPRKQALGMQRIHCAGLLVVKGGGFGHRIARHVGVVFACIILNQNLLNCVCVMLAALNMLLVCSVVL